MNEHPPACPAYYTPAHVAKYDRPYCTCERVIERCGCGHGKDVHCECCGSCQSGDDDGDGYFDQCWCRAYRARAPFPPGIMVEAGPGTHTSVTLPDGTVHPINPVTLSSTGQIFVPITS